jgi:hypothetical protein
MAFYDHLPPEWEEFWWNLWDSTYDLMTGGFEARWAREHAKHFCKAVNGRLTPPPEGADDDLYGYFYDAAQIYRSVDIPSQEFNYLHNICNHVFHSVETYLRMARLQTHITETW